jgi:hypothetical protein
LSARNTLIEFGYLAARICAPDFKRPGPVCVDSRQAIDHPERYVAEVATAAGLFPTPAQVAEAVANIDDSLYRVRIDDESVQRFAASIRPLERIYDLLRSNDPLKWLQLRDSLPRWILDSFPRGL